MIDIDKIANQAYTMAQRKEVAIILSNDAIIAVSTNTRDYKRSKARHLIGIYNNAASYQWILEDLRSSQNGISQ